jgi:hypothetical protein
MEKGKAESKSRNHKAEPEAAKEPAYNLRNEKGVVQFEVARASCA